MTTADRRPSELHLAVSLESTEAQVPSRDDHIKATGRGALYSAIQLAEQALVDLVLIEDRFGGVKTPLGTRGAVDSVLLAATALARTGRIGIAPTVSTTHTEPFHISKAVATLDHISRGRAAWQVAVSTDQAEADLFGRKQAVSSAAAYAEAAEAIEVIKLLWDSWDDDSVIRDASRGWYIDRSRVHYINHAGENFSVKGPSMTPRSPQGRPPVVVHLDAGELADYAIAAVVSRADIVRLAASDVEQAADATRQARELAAGTAKIFVDAALAFDTERDGRRRLDAYLDAVPNRAALPLTGRVGDVTAAIVQRVAETGADGLVLQPADPLTDLSILSASLTPALQRTGLFQRAYAPGTLRDRFAQPRPPSLLAGAALTTAGSPA